MNKPSFSKEELEIAVKEAECFSDILRALNLCPTGGSSRNTINKYCSLWNIDTSHILSMQMYMKKYHTTFIPSPTPLSKYLIENSTYSRSSLKKRLYKEKLKKPFCELCGQGEIWNSKKISLILDHINGINNDNRLENLRILCPNCNASLDTHCGKNNRLKVLCKCGSKMYKTSVECKICSSKRKEYIVWPSKEELYKLVWQKPVSSLAKELGVSDSAIIRRCKKMKIKSPSRGFWQKKGSIAQQVEQMPPKRQD